MAGKTLKQAVQDAIYQARWVDAFGKNGEIATDEQITNVVLEAIDKGSEYEYNVSVSRHGQGVIYYNTWITEQEMTGLWSCEDLSEVSNNIPESWTLVKRRRAGGIEDV